MSQDKDYFEDLLNTIDDEVEEVQETNEEEQRRKNKDAEEARKRREAEAKEKAEAEAKAKAEEEEKAAKEKAEQEAKAKAEEEANKKAEAELKKKGDQTNRLGEQLVNFKARYPEVDLSALDKDANFKKFINGKLLGKQNFIELYEDYIDLTSSISGKTQEDLKKNYALKSKASSGTSKPAGKAEAVAEVFSQEELDRITARMPLMSDAEVKRIQEKFDRSVDYYKKNK